METKSYLRTKVDALHTRIGLRRFFHEECGLSGAEAAAKVRELLASAEEEAEGKQLTRAGIAKAFRDIREGERKRMGLLYLAVQSAAHKEAWATKPDPGTVLGPNDWVDVFGEERLLNPQEQHKHNIAMRMVGEMAAELDQAKDADELEAKLVRMGVDETIIEPYMHWAGFESKFAH